MKAVFYRAILLSAVLLFAALIGVAQPGAASNSGSMFAGEVLSFEGKVNKILRGMTVADLTFTAEKIADRDELLIKSEADSKGTLLKLFRFSFLQQYESTVDLDSFRILRTTKHDVQKERVRDSEAVFDYEKKIVTYVETDPKDLMRPPRRIASEIGGKVYDMISAIYALRLLPLSVGQRLEFTVSDSGLVYKIPFTVTRRQKQKTIFGKVSCFRVEPEIFGNGRLIEQKGKMVIWLVDDARHTPVRSEIKTKYGKFDIKLKSATVGGRDLAH